jgi:hypothetical protein
MTGLSRFVEFFTQGGKYTNGNKPIRCVQEESLTKRLMLIEVWICVMA